MHQFHNETSLLARTHSKPFLDMRVATVGSFFVTFSKKEVISLKSPEEQHVALPDSIPDPDVWGLYIQLIA